MRKEDPLMALGRGLVLRARYEVDSVVGEGAMAVVYRIRDLRDGGVRALKTLDLDEIPEQEVEEARALFEREARFLYGLNHPGFPQVTDYFTEGDLCCQVMDLIAGETLEARVEREGPLGEDEVVRLADELCLHLQFLHRHPAGPIVYRDLKPSNVMLADDGAVHLVDFGIARVYKPGDPRDTQFLGTPGYAAPEQYGGRQSSPASDVYALGATLRFALTGEHPEPPGLPRKPLPPCGRELAWLLDQAMLDDPERRPRSADQVAQVLADVHSPIPDRLHGALMACWLRAEFFRWPRWERSFHPSVGATLLATMLGFCLFTVAFPATQRARQYTQCEANIAQIRAALDIYGQDNHGRYPRELSSLVPRYLPALPTCPRNGDVYRTAYRVSSDGRAYTETCGHDQYRFDP
jgi:serine/threonine protein kinase